MVPHELCQGSASPAQIEEGEASTLMVAIANGVIFAADQTIALDFALHRLAGLIERLVVYPRRMRDNLDALGGLIHSQAVLLALTRAGMEREAAYAAVQRNAMLVWEEGADFRAALAGDADIAALLDGETLDELFDLDRHLRHLDTIFDRVFGAAPEARPAGA